MADIGRLWQAGRAGGVNQESTVGDGYCSTLRCTQCIAGKLGDRLIDPRKRAVSAMRPEFWPALQARRQRLQVCGKFGRGNHMRGRYRINAMGERRPAQLRVDQRDDDANGAKPEPDGHVIRPVRQHQANGVALGDVLCDRPASVRVGPRCERGVGQALGGGDERRRIGRCLRQIFDDVEQQAVRLGGNRRGRFERAQPIALRRLADARCRPSLFGFEEGHRKQLWPNKVNLQVRDCLKFYSSRSDEAKQAAD